MPSKQILERLIAKKSPSADELRIIEENNRPMTEQEKRDIEAQISEQDKLNFEIYDLSDQIITGLIITLIKCQKLNYKQCFYNINNILILN
jgi:hypothetical protein